MKTIQTVLAAALLVAAATAQAGAATGAKAERDAIAAEWKAAQKVAADARKAVQASEAWQAAVKAKDRAKLDELMAGVGKVDGAAYGARALEAAKKYEGDDRLLLLTWAAVNAGDPAVAKSVITAVATDHLQSKALVELLENAPALSRGLPADEADAFLGKVVAQSPHAEARAWAMYWRAMTMQRGKDVADDRKAEAQRLLDGAEVLAAGTPLAERIAAPRFEKERLQIGMVAPDIEGEDLDGVAFRLSDYRGKVVVLDFWGFW